MGRFVSASGEGAAEVVGTTLANRGWQAELENIGATRISQQRVSTAPKMCAAHGMYTCGQVLLVEGRTVTIGWDSHNVPDPSHDVGRMLIYLKRVELKRPRLNFESRALGFSWTPNYDENG